MSKSMAPMVHKALVLIVDDEPAALTTLQALLADMYDVQVAGSARQAEQVLAGYPVQVLVTDYDMPDRSGMDLIAAVLHKFPHVVPILLTGHTLKREVRLADKDRNVFAVLGKPCDPQSLLRSLRLAVVTAQLRALHHKAPRRKVPA